jgi:hypothetical protein
MKTPFEHGRTDCYLDKMENVPFASVGGLGRRSDMTVPEYVDPPEAGEYLRGYRDAAASLYGADWETCEFGWRRAMVIDKEGDRDEST